MNQHQRITGEFERQYEMLRDAVIIAPSALAMQIFHVFANGEEEPHVQYTSVEHLKQMARDFLRKRKGTDSEQSEAYKQAEFDIPEMFTGKLQDRYPLPRKMGEEPVYKLRNQLTVDERNWNVMQLRKSGDARHQHADALEAEGKSLSQTG